MLVRRPPELPVLGREWLAWLERERLTVLDLPTAHWHHWVRELTGLGAQLPASLRAVIVGGERWAAPTAAGSSSAGARVRLVNTYGPTEASIVATAWAPPPDTELESDPPVGRPLPGVSALVLDPASR